MKDVVDIVYHPTPSIDLLIFITKGNAQIVVK